MFVITADQKSSRTGADLVPQALQAVERAAAGRLALPPERSTGDELQLATPSPDATVEVALLLLRDQHWSVGIGVGEVEHPLPSEVRAARGPAFIHAREAVDRAKKSTTRVAVSGEELLACQDAEALLRLLVELRDRRSRQGWEITDLLQEGLTQREAAERLGITETAVSLRVKSAGLRVEEPAIPALGRVLSRLS